MSQNDLIKTIRMNYLFDFYQALLTQKQRNYLELFYLQDYSLSEIADTFDVSRQAVYDNIRRTGYLVEDYEMKLGLYRNFEQRQKLYEQIKQHVNEPEKIKQYIQALEDLD
ncbi:putative DNA-binding protein [Staphylococcus xylosus]